MFRLCWEKYIIDKKIDGYHLWERVSPFNYVEKVKGAESLTNFFIRDDVNTFGEHILSKKQAESAYKNYDVSYSTHISMSENGIQEHNLDFSYGTYDDFITEFTKQQLSENGWDRDEQNLESFFAHKDNSKIHASRIVFNDVHMIMKTLADWVKFCEFIEENKLKPDKLGENINRW